MKKNPLNALSADLCLRYSMKICAYVQEQYAKTAYKKECLDTRQFAGLKVIIDSLERTGHSVEYAGIATVHEYDIVLVSLTSDCDWWTFVKERLRWRKGNYKVIVGGAGVLHVTPFLRWFDFAVIGRGEHIMAPLIDGIESDGGYDHESVIDVRTFSPDKIYRVAQTDCIYPHQIRLTDKKDYVERAIGCNHKCFFCGYTWQRKFISSLGDVYKMPGGLFDGMEDKERAMLDMINGKEEIDWAHLRTTAIDGFSERLRKMVNKPITRENLRQFLGAMLNYSGKPHQIKFFNICGYPSETEDDWREFAEDIRLADDIAEKREKQWSIVLHNTPFRAMPATPMACAPMAKRNFRGEISRTIGNGLKGNLIYQGKSLWSVESSGTEGLPTVMLSALAHRGSENDSENIERLCRAPKFWRASNAEKEAVLAKLFDMDKLFGSFTPADLPSRYLRTYEQVERLWTRKYE